MDDDISSIFKKKHKKNLVDRKTLSEIEEINLYDFIKQSFKILREKKLNLFGINAVKNTFLMTDNYSIDLRFIHGPFYGYINIHNTKYDLPISTKYYGVADDIERTIIYYRNDGGVLRFNEYSCIHDYKCKGGIEKSLNGINRNEINLKIIEDFANMYFNYGMIYNNKKDGKTFKLYKKFKNV
jgi:hypothetical protein